MWPDRTRLDKLNTGAVLAERYHLRVLRSPRQVRNALAYVLLNWLAAAWADLTR